MNNDTLFSAHPVTWSRVQALYGEAAQVIGVRTWFHPEKGWQGFPATTAISMLPEQQIIALANAGATSVQLCIQVTEQEISFPDFHIHELYTPPSTTPASPPAVIL